MRETRRGYPMMLVTEFCMQRVKLLWWPWRVHNVSGQVLSFDAGVWGGLPLTKLNLLFYGIGALVFTIWLIASMAASLFSIIVSSHCSIASLVDSIVSVGISSVSYPRRISLGDNLVVAFRLLLCTAVAITIQLVQASGEVEVTRHKYCSTYWFFLSDSPSVWGWNAVDKFCSIPNLRVIAFPKWDVNLGSRSLIIFFGNSNHLYTWSMYAWAMPSSVILVVQGMNTTAREHPSSTIVRMASFPLCNGSPVIRSIVIRSKGQALFSVPMWNGGVLLLCVWILFCWHIAHPFTYSMIHSFMPSHIISALVFLMVSLHPRCPAVGWSCMWSMIVLFISVVIRSFGVTVEISKFSGGITVCAWLSFFPWSTPGGHDRASGGILSFPSICRIS